MNHDSTWPQTEIKKRNHKRDILPVNQTASLFKTRATRGPTGLPLKAVSSLWLKASKQIPLGKHAAHRPLVTLRVSEFMSRFMHSYRMLCRRLPVSWPSLFFGLLRVYGIIFSYKPEEPIWASGARGQLASFEHGHHLATRAGRDDCSLIRTWAHSSAILVPELGWTRFLSTWKIWPLKGNGKRE